jgi:putative colanic acid biosysnthesis UDP-glucose lipid carrier transferase
LFQEHYNRIALPLFFLLDIIIATGLFSFGQSLYNNNIPPFFYVFSIALFWAIPALYFKSYRAPRSHSNQAALKPTFMTWCVFSLIYVFSSAFGFSPTIPTEGHGLYLLTLGVAQHGISILRFNYFHNYRLKGKNIRNVLFIGSILNQNRFEKLKQDCLHFGYHIQYKIEDSNRIGELKDIINHKNIDLVFLRQLDESQTREITNICDQVGIRIKLLLNMDVATGRKVGLDIMGGFPVMDVRKEPLQYLGNRTIKRSIDIAMASISIVLALSWFPLIVKLAQIISYPGPLFFIQKRIGRDGKTFNLYKFRTMTHTNESELAKMGHATKTCEKDARVPWFGQILRKTNLDEYPQFLNVLMGSMSTVGPRPHMVGEDQELADRVINYRVRRFIKPGITGFAAIKGYRGGTDDIKLMSKRTDHDIWYLENWSLWLDIKIIATTIWQMVTFRIPKAY